MKPTPAASNKGLPAGKVANRVANSAANSAANSVTNPAANSGIAELAERAGFIIDWEDALGKTQRVPDATLASLLEHLGLPCRTEASLAQSLATLDAESPERRLAPLLTATLGHDIVLPRGVVQEGAPYTIMLEAGGTIEGTVRKHAHAGKHDGMLSIAAIDVAGYHTLSIAGVDIQLAVAPMRCFSVSDAAARLHDVDASASASGAVPLGAPHLKPHLAESKRLWGISAQVYGLRRDGDAGIGDFTALAMLARASAREGAAAIAISPMHAMFSADPGKFSPYSPSSRLFSNVLHVDAGAFFERSEVDAAVEALALGATLAELEQAPLIDWPQVATTKLAILRYLFDRWPAEDARRAAFAAFCAAGGTALENHARFEALHVDRVSAAAAAETAAETDGTSVETKGSAYNWRDWPEGLRDPRSRAVELFARAHRDDVDFHLFLQWLADSGLADAQRAAREAGMPIGLIADLAVGCDGAGSQTWSDPESMLNGLSVGAPPDVFNQAGQAWGLTTFSPRALVNQGFRAFIEMVRGAFAHAGGIRVDHILGLRRLWLVPEGEAARNGAYLRYPLDDLLRLLALESWRHHAIVIGEDLGTVPPGLRERLAESGLLGMRVLWFERESASAASSRTAERNEAESEASSEAKRGANRKTRAARSAASDIADITNLRDLGTLDELTDISAMVSMSDDDTDDTDDSEGAEGIEDADPALSQQVSEKRDGFVPPAKWTQDAIAMTTTHDLPTIVGWWEGHDIAWRAKIGQSGDDAAAHRQEQAERLADRAVLWRALIDAGIVASDTAEPAEAPIDAILQFVAAAHAPLALFPLEDLLGLEDQPNLPGSIDEHPNWRRRLPLRLEAEGAPAGAPAVTRSGRPDTAAQAAAPDTPAAFGPTHSALAAAVKTRQRLISTTRHASHTAHPSTPASAHSSASSPALSSASPTASSK